MKRLGNLPIPAWSSLGNRLIARLSHALLPPSSCLLCASSTTEAVICPACRADLPWRNHAAQYCAQCGLPSPLHRVSASDDICPHCQTAPPAFTQTIAAFDYEFPLRQLIHRYKYGGELSLARFFAHALAHAIAQQTHFNVSPNTVLLPLPLHAQRLRERGFNQAMEIARPLSKLLGLPCRPHLCQRHRPTVPQAGLARKDRLTNLRHAFSCAHELQGQSILLLDDVMTTGSSVQECARTLLLHGASRVDVVVVARALPTGVGIRRGVFCQ